MHLPSTDRGAACLTFLFRPAFRNQHCPAIRARCPVYGSLYYPDSACTRLGTDQRFSSSNFGATLFVPWRLLPSAAHPLRLSSVCAISSDFFLTPSGAGLRSNAVMNDSGRSHQSDTQALHVPPRKRLKRPTPPRDIRRIFCLSAIRDGPLSSAHACPPAIEGPFCRARLSLRTAVPDRVIDPCVHSLLCHARRFSAPSRSPLPHTRYVVVRAAIVRARGCLSSGALCTETQRRCTFPGSAYCDRASATSCVFIKSPWCRRALRPRGRGLVRP